MSEPIRYVMAIVAPDDETGQLPECSYCGAPTEQVLVDASTVENTPVHDGPINFQASYAVCADCMQTKLQFIAKERPS